LKTVVKMVAGSRAKYYDEQPGDKEKIHKVLLTEIISDKHWCLVFARMGSNACRRYAVEHGWHHERWRKSSNRWG